MKELNDMICSNIYHVHTYRCQHASDDREINYVKKAIELGAMEVVFTDHCPFPGDPFGLRMQMRELSDYVETLKKLRQEYKNDIQIKIGLEAEYIPTYADYYRYLLEEAGVEALLLGQHFSLLNNGEYSFTMHEKSMEARVLADGMIQGMESGFFNIVAHPDQIFRRYKTWNNEATEITIEILDCARRTGVVLERNIKNMLLYPKEKRYWPEFWNLCPKDAKTICGLDAHSVESMVQYYSKYF